MPMMKSLRSFRLASTTGHIIEVEAETPIYVAPAIYREAITAGMVEVDEAIPQEPEAAEPIVVDETNTSEFDQEAALTQALMRIITRSDESELKNNGVPKTHVVNKELPIEAERATSTQVDETFQKLQESIDLVE